MEVVILTTSSAASDENFIKMKTFPFQWLTSLLFRIIHSDYFEIWPKKYKVKVVGVFRGRSHIVSPPWTRFTSFAFQINHITHSCDKAFSYFDLKNPRPTSWVKSKVEKIHNKNNNDGNNNNTHKHTRTRSRTRTSTLTPTLLTSWCGQTNICLLVPETGVN